MVKSLVCAICDEKINRKKQYLKDQDTGNIYHMDCFQQNHPDVPISGLEQKKPKPGKERTMKDLRKQYKKRFKEAADTTTTKQELIDALDRGITVKQIRSKRLNRVSLERELNLIPNVVSIQDSASVFSRYNPSEPKLISTRFGNIEKKSVGDIMILGETVMRWSGREWLPEHAFLRNTDGYKRSPVRTDLEVSSLSSPFVFQKRPNPTETERKGFTDPDSAVEWAEDNGFTVDDVWWDQPSRSFAVKFRRAPIEAAETAMATRGARHIQSNPPVGVPMAFLLSRDHPFTEGMMIGVKCGDCSFYQVIGESTGACQVEARTDEPRYGVKIGDHFPCGYYMTREAGRS